MNLFDKTKLLTWYAGKQMSLGIKRLFNLSLTNEKAWNPSLWNLAGAKSTSGETVTEATALTYSAFWNAVTLLSGTTSSLPLNLMQKVGDTKKLVDDKPLHRVLHSQWNPYMTAMAGRECLHSHILTWGNGYAEIVRDRMGNIMALWPIPPNRMTKMEMVDGILLYEITVDGEAPVTLMRNKDDPMRSNILHIPGLGFDGLQGYSVVAMARQSIGLGLAMETFGSRYFGAGTHPGLVISHPGKLDPTTHSNLETSLATQYGGLGQTHRLMLLDESMKPEKIGVDPEDSQFIESRAHQIPEIARWFNLPPHKLKDLSKSSFNNIESEQISFVTDSVLPWLIREEQNYNMQLLTPAEQKAGLYTNHVVEGLLRGDAEGRAKYYQIMVNIGAMTRNEVRAKENMNPNTSPLADELFVALNTIPMSKYEEYLDAKFLQETMTPEIPETTEVIENANKPKLIQGAFK